MVKVFLFCADIPIDFKYSELLPLWRRERFLALRNEKARQECLAAGLLYSYALADCGISADNEPVCILPAGKPIFSGRNDVYFSISHSGGWAACAIGSVPLGVDIQSERPIKDTMLRRFHPEEQAYYAGLSDEEKQHAFFRLWTRKEAWVKAKSAGHMLTLDECSVLHDFGGVLFKEFAPTQGLCGAVCLTESENVDIIRVSRDTLLAGCIEF